MEEIQQNSIKQKNLNRMKQFYKAVERKFESIKQVLSEQRQHEESHKELMAAINDDKIQRTVHKLVADN